MRSVLGTILVVAASVMPLIAQEEPNDVVHIQIVPDSTALSESQHIASMEAKLKSSKAKLNVQDLPLSAVAEILSAQLDIPIRLHYRGLEDVGLSADTPVDFQLPEVAADTILQLFLYQQDLTYRLEAEGIVITTPEEAEQHTQARFYNIEALIPGPNRDYDAIIDLVSTSIDPESWDVGSGPSSIMPYQNGIILQQSPGVHQKIEGLLVALREAKHLPAGAYPTKALIASPLGNLSAANSEKLQRTKVTLEADSLPLLDVVRQFEKHTSVPFFVDRRALEEIGESPESTVKLSLHNVNVHHALDVLAEQYDLTWFSMGEVVVVTTPEEAVSEMEVRVYPVRDLTWNGLNPDNRDALKWMEAAKCDNRQDSTGRFDFSGWSFRLHSQDIPEFPSRTEDLLRSICLHIAPNSWEESGGPGGIAYFPLADCLVVSQSQRVHRQIAKLLQTIRNHQKPLDLNKLASSIRQADEATLVMFYKVPRDRQGTPRLTQRDLKVLARRIQRLFGQGTWDQESYFIDVTQSTLIVRHRRDVQRQIQRFWSHLGPDESMLSPSQDKRFNQPTHSAKQAEDGSAPEPQHGGVF